MDNQIALLHRYRELGSTVNFPAWTADYRSTLVGIESSGSEKHSDAIPPDFQGVWAAQTSAKTACAPGDWEAHELDSLSRIGVREVEFWESVCEVTAIAHASESEMIKIDLTCSGEGEEWTSTQLWGLSEVSGRNLLVTVDPSSFVLAVYTRCLSEPKDSENRILQELGSFPLGSCKGWSGTITDISGIDTQSASMEGIVTKANLREYCIRDPGGETIAYGGGLTINQCVDKYAEEADILLSTKADCTAGVVSFEANADRSTATFPVPDDADTSCASGMPPLISQFELLCPSSNLR